MAIDSKWRRAWMAALVLAAVGAGCGDDDDGSGDGRGQDAGLDAGLDAGNQPSAGRGGTAGTGGRSSGTAGTGGRMAPMAMCDMTIEPEERCGNRDCPELPPDANACTISCCVNNQCGTQSTSLQNGRACQPLGVPDSRCPDYNGPSSGTGQTVMRTGCCSPEGLCGIISSISGTCITESPFLDLPENPRRCDETDLDGGVEPDAG